MLEIRKKGLKHFRHYEGEYEPYSANDIRILFEGNIVKLRSFSGRVIFDKDGYLFSDVRVYDDTGAGTEESFPNIESFQQRLINLGYPFLGNENEIIYAGTTWDVIAGDPTTNLALVSYVESEAGIQAIVEGQNIAVDNTDPNNPIVSLTGIIDGGTVT